MEGEINQHLIFEIARSTLMQTQTGTLTEAEIDFLVNYLQKSKEAFIEVINKTPDELWFSRPSPDQWSPSECADHILQTEIYYLQPNLDQMLAQEADPSRTASTKGKDEVSYRCMENRDQRIKATPVEEAVNQNIKKEEVIKNFSSKRDEVLQWLKSTDLPLRHYYTELPGLETVDAYQFLLFIGGHTYRHIFQMEEILEKPIQA